MRLPLKLISKGHRHLYSAFFTPKGALRDTFNSIPGPFKP